MNAASWIILTVIGLALTYALIAAAVSAGTRHAHDAERRDQRKDGQP